MKQQTAKLRYLRMAPRKVRLISNVIKKLTVNEAEAQLLINPKRATEPILKLLRSAIANAKNNGMDVEKLIVKEIKVDGGPMMKKWLPRAQGRATPIQKKSSHVSITLEESEKAKGPRFTIIKKEKIKKSEAEKIKKEKIKDQVESKKVKADKGFGKRMFQRKSI